MTELKLQQCRVDGRYDILDCLGRGSYSEIYVARDTAATDPQHETVVIKALNTHLQGTPDAELEHTLVENFQNEALALDRVRHPNIISRLGHGTAIDLAGITFHYLVLEYLSGGDMAALCYQHPLSLERALFYLEQVCAGLAFAHEHGVIHRDIKPQNLLLTTDREVLKIADFGVAKIEATEGAITRVGTNVYAAPEHNPLVQTGSLEGMNVTGRLPMLTPAADIYSLAKTTYTLLTGEPPRRFAHHPITELPASIADEFWSESVLRVLRRATQSRPLSRYQTVQEFWEELSDAALPPTQLLRAPSSGEDAVPRTTGRLNEDRRPVSSAPPRPTFNRTRVAAPSGVQGNGSSAMRPRIVVRVAEDQPPKPLARVERKTARETIAALPDVKKQEAAKKPERKSAPASPLVRVLVAALLILAFSGMLLATHYYFSHRNQQQTRSVVPAAPKSDINQEGTIIHQSVKLRPDPSTENPEIGVAELGSRVRVLNESNNWYQIEVIQHSQPKEDPDSQDRGWVKKYYVQLKD